MRSTVNYLLPKWLALTVLCSLCFIFVMMPIHAFISTWGGTAIGPLWLWKGWKELLLAVLSLVLLTWVIVTPRALKYLARRPLVIAITAYVLLTALSAALTHKAVGVDATGAGLAMNLRYLAAASVAYLLFLYADIGKVWLERAVNFVIIAGVVLSVLGILQALVLPANTLEWFGYDKETTIAPATLIDNNPELLRAFATLRGPNDFGAFLIMPILFVIARFNRLAKWRGVSALFVMSWALILTSSRSAWLGMLAALAVFVLVGARRRFSTRQVCAVMTIGTILLLALVYASIVVAPLRMAIFHSSPGDPSLTEGSTDNHLAATVGGIERVIDAPLGCGVGCSGPASYYGTHPQISESYFVQIAEEVGVLGIILFLMIIGFTVRSLLQIRDERSRVLLAALAGYGVIGVLLHVFADDPLSITWWLLAGAAIGYNERQSWTKSKNNSPSKPS